MMSGGHFPAASVDAVIIGAGHSGLAASHCLAELGVEHVVFERGEVANTWRRERWDSLTLLTPNWLATLPGYRYQGDDPDSYMNSTELVRFIEGYAGQAQAPIHAHTMVTAVTPDDPGYRVETTEGAWRTRAVVLANGGFNTPAVPACAAGLPGHIAQFTAHDYRNPGQLPDGGVMVVGASATGLQIADEIHRSGRPVTLAVGEHVRLPRCYRGRDIYWWMCHTGLMDERYDQVDDIVRARNLPSPQLVGTPEQRSLDLNSLTDKGVRLVGRLAAVRDGKALFSGGLRNVCALADLKMNRLLNEIDQWIDAQGGVPGAGDMERYPDTRVEHPPRLGLDLAKDGIKSVLWATGFRPDYAWLKAPVLDRKGHVKHDGGVVKGAPGMYLLGLQFLRTRKSSFIHGAEDDARFISQHLFKHLEAQSGRSAVPSCA